MAAGSWTTSRIDCLHDHLADLAILAAVYMTRDRRAGILGAEE